METRRSEEQIHQREPLSKETWLKEADQKEEKRETVDGDERQKTTYQKKSYKLFIAWMAFFTMALYVCAVNEVNFFGLGMVRTNCIVLYVLLDLLMLLIYAMQSIYWINGMTYEQAAAASADERRRYAFRHLRIFLAATVLYIGYCCIPTSVLALGGMKDSIVAGGILCAAAIWTIPIHL